MEVAGPHLRKVVMFTRTVWSNARGLFANIPLNIPLDLGTGLTPPSSAHIVCLSVCLSVLLE